MEEGNTDFYFNRFSPQLRKLSYPRPGERGQPRQPSPRMIGFFSSDAQKSCHLIVAVRQLLLSGDTPSSYPNAVSGIRRDQSVVDSKIEDRTDRPQIGIVDRLFRETLGDESVFPLDHIGSGNAPRVFVTQVSLQRIDDSLPSQRVLGAGRASALHRSNNSVRVTSARDSNGGNRSACGSGR